MRKWVNPNGPGKISIGALPNEIERQLRDRVTNVLQRSGQTDDLIRRVAQGIVVATSWAFVGRQVRLANVGAGRRPDASGNLLSLDIEHILKAEGLRGNWLAPGDAQEDGVPGLVAELEAIAQTAYKQACGSDTGTAARPARVSAARNLLGKVTRD
jgi:hypothetical protein